MDDKESVHIRCVKLYFVGPPNVGKTTTLNRLLKIYENIDLASPEQKEYQSTLLANCFQAMALVNQDKPKWIFSIDCNRNAQMLISYLFSSEKLNENVSTPESSQGVNMSPSDNVDTTQSDQHVYKQPLPREKKNQFPQPLATPTHPDAVKESREKEEEEEKFSDIIIIIIILFT